MSKLTFGKVCPHCGHETFHRIGRSWWMRVVPGSRHYHCVFCYSKFVVIDTESLRKHRPQSTNTHA